jgi:hypothetical protein
MMKCIWMGLCLILAPVCLFAQGAGKALSFNGSSYVELVKDYQASLPISISLWVKPGAGMDNHIPLVATDSWQDGTYHGVNLAFTPTGISISFGDGTGNSPSDRRTKSQIYTFAAQQWYHITGIIRSATNMNLYINGIDIGGNYDGTGGALANTTSRMRLANHYSTLYYQGHIEEVHIWSRALSADEIRHNMCHKLTGTEPGLVAYYRMDEGAAATCLPTGDVCDATGNGNHGTRY